MKPRHILRFFLFLLAACLITVQCGKAAQSVPFAELRAAASRGTGWAERTDQYRAFTAREFYNIVDGEAAVHEQLGLINGFGITLVSQGKLADIYFEDFGSPSRAKAMVGMKKKSSSDPKKMPHVESTVATYDEVIGGCVAYYATARCYVEMTFTGYHSSDSAVHDAAILIDSINLVMRK